MAKTLEGAGAAAVALHARTRAQGYSGKADWGLIGRVKQAVGIPVIGNGDVRSRCRRGPPDARDRLRRGDDGPRGAGVPLDLSRARRWGGRRPPSRAPCRSCSRHFLEHLSFLRGTSLRRGRGFDELHALRQFRKHLLWYAHGLRGAAAFRARAVRLEGKEEILAAMDAFFGEAATLEPHERLSEPEYDERAALG